MNSQARTAYPSVSRHLHFLVGQDRAGHWVALETHGLGSGLFRSREAAIRYAGINHLAVAAAS